MDDYKNKYNESFENIWKEYFDNNVDAMVREIFNDQNKSDTPQAATTDATTVSNWYTNNSDSSDASKLSGWSVGNGQLYWDDINTGITSTKISADEIELDGLSLKDVLHKMQDRLAILDNPDPEKLEKFAALKKAYEQYKILERLCYEQGDAE